MTLVVSGVVYKKKIIYIYIYNMKVCLKIVCKKIYNKGLFENSLFS